MERMLATEERQHNWSLQGMAGVKIGSQLGVTGCECDGFSGVKEVRDLDVWDIEGGL